MLFRNLPKYFSNMLAALNVNQRKAVVEKEFRAILNFSLQYLPPKLAYWVATHFNPLTCNLPIGKVVGVKHADGNHIDEVDVHLTLGFPKGMVLLQSKKKGSNFALMDDIANKEGKPRRLLSPDNIEKHMLKEENGGDLFKKLFLVLLEYYLIKAPSDGFLRPKILHLIDDVSNVHNYSWCKYVLSLFLDVYETWNESRIRYYTGPTVFLVVSLLILDFSNL